MLKKHALSVRPVDGWASQPVINQEAVTVASVEARSLAVTDKHGVAFTTWEKKHAEMFTLLDAFSQEENSGEPGPLSAIISTAAAYVSFANARTADAKGYMDRACNIAKLGAGRVMGDHEAGTLMRVACWPLIDEYEHWKALADSLQEKLNAAKAVNRGFEGERNARQE